MPCKYCPSATQYKNLDTRVLIANYLPKRNTIQEISFTILEDAESIKTSTKYNCLTSFFPKDHCHFHFV